MTKGNHTFAILEILKGVIKYECGFCGVQFDKASECAKHIESDSLTGFVNPEDIKIAIVKNDIQPQFRLQLTLNK